MMENVMMIHWMPASSTWQFSLQGDINIFKLVPGSREVFYTQIL